MKTLFLSLLFLGLCFTNHAQTEPQKGDELIINEAVTYNYVKFPRLNILSKRGKVANYKSEYGTHVIVDEVMTKANGSTYVILKKKDGTKFFGLDTKVKANFAKAVAAGEIEMVKP